MRKRNQISGMTLLAAAFMALAGGSSAFANQAYWNAPGYPPQVSIDYGQSAYDRAPSQSASIYTYPPAIVYEVAAPPPVIPAARVVPVTVTETTYVTEESY